MILKIVPDAAASTPPPCKGRYYRFIESIFTGKGGRIVFTKEVRLLKSISCAGCETCWREEEGLSSLLSEDPSGAIDFSGPLETGDTIALIFVEDSRDRETGYIEEYHYKAIEVKPEELKA